MVEKSNCASPEKELKSRKKLLRNSVNASNSSKIDFLYPNLNSNPIKKIIKRKNMRKKIKRLRIKSNNEKLGDPRIGEN